MWARAEFEQHGRQAQALDSLARGGALVGQLLQRRADEHAQTLVGSADDRVEFRHRAYGRSGLCEGLLIFRSVITGDEERCRYLLEHIKALPFPPRAGGRHVEAIGIDPSEATAPTGAMLLRDLDSARRLWIEVVGPLGSAIVAGAAQIGSDQTGLT